jgi:RNA polymerase sigma-70 factor (ECF subfamily)
MVLERETLMSFKSGNQAAFALVVEAMRQRIFRLCWKILGNRAAAEDATQEALLKIYEKRDRIDLERHAEAWMMRVAVNHARDWHRRRREWATDMAFLEQPASLPHPLDALQTQEEAEQVVAALGRLTAKFREILALRFGAGQELKAISSILGISIGTVKSRLSRALVAFTRAYMEQRR